MGSTATAGPEAALVVASYGRRYLLRFEADGAERPAVSRGKRTEACVGDHVAASRLGVDQAVIERIEPRRNLLQRSDRYRSKALAANVDQIGRASCRERVEIPAGAGARKRKGRRIDGVV